MFLIGSNRKEFENQGVNCICLHMSAVREMVAPTYKHLFVLTYSHLCFNVGLPPSFTLTEQQYPVCYWSNIMIKGAVCRTKNRPAFQLCYPAVHCSRQVVSFLPPGRLGQVQRKWGTFGISFWGAFKKIVGNKADFLEFLGNTGTQTPSGGLIIKGSQTLLQICYWTFNASVLLCSNKYSHFL